MFYLSALYICPLSNPVSILRKALLPTFGRLLQLESKHEEDRLKYEEEIVVLQENLDQMKQLQQDVKEQVKLYWLFACN